MSKRKGWDPDYRAERDQWMIERTRKWYADCEQAVRDESYDTCLTCGQEECYCELDIDGRSGD
jgi:hypothetical protein